MAAYPRTKPMSNNPHNARRTLLEIFRRAKRERDALIDIIRKQRIVISEQQRLIVEQPSKRCATPFRN
jgi:hypothetical protein